MELIKKIKKQILIVDNQEKILFNLFKEYGYLNSVFKKGQEVYIKGFSVSYIVDNSIYNNSKECITYNLQQKGREYTHYKLDIDEKDIYIKKIL